MLNIGLFNKNIRCRDLFDYKYLVFYLKYKTQHVLKTWSIASVFLLTKNMKLDI